MIVVVGDTHGIHDVRKVNELSDRNMKDDLGINFLIIAGDFGFVWENDPDNPGEISDNDMYFIQKIFGSQPWVTLFVPGNHENYDILDKLPRKEVNGAMCAELIPGKVYMVDRGEIITLEGKKFLCIGGARSVDKAYRKEHISWWEQEEITPCDIDRAKFNLARNDNDVDYVITHTAPTDIATLCIAQVAGPRYSEYSNKNKDKSCKYLYDIRDTFTFKKWLFGHFHIDKEIGDTYVAMYDTPYYIGEE